MRFVMSIFLLVFAQMAMGVTPRKILVEVVVTPENANCFLDSNSVVTRRAQTATPEGTVTGGCLNSHSSGVNYGFAYQAIRLGKVLKTCDKQIVYHTNVDTVPGAAGMLENWVDQGACMEGTKHYHRYDADTTP